MKLKLTLTTAIAAAGVGGLLADQAAALPSACNQSGRTVTCTYMSGSNPFTVPAGVFSIHVVAVGGAGGAGDQFGFPEGRPGAVVSGDLPVKMGSTLYAVVGANAGALGGGAASDLRTSQNDLSTRLLVAGGGGGAGGSGVAFLSGGFPAFTPGGAGGAGGGNDGIGGGGSGGGGGGGGGGSSGGGAGGAGNSGCFGPLGLPPFPICGAGQNGSAGGFGFGGEGGSGTGFSQTGLFIVGGRGGRGGAGWFGGGGGGGAGLGSNGGGGGGGGSNLVPPGGSQSVDTTGIQLITISYIHGRPQG